MRRPPAGVLVLAALGLAGCPTETEAVTPCARAADCASGTTCIDGACRPSVACDSSRSCPDLVCDVVIGVCVECVAANDCPAAEHCAEGVCAPGADGDAGADGGVADADTMDAGDDAALAAPDAGDDASASDDVGIDAPLDAALPGCDPATRRDLFAWYRADLGVTDAAGRFTWADQGPTHYDLDGPSGPVVVPSAVNGHPAIDVGASALQANGPFAPTWEIGSHTTVAIVFRVDAPGDGTMFGKGGSSATPGLHSFFVATHAADSALDVVFSSETLTLPASAATTGRAHLLMFHADGPVDVSLDGVAMGHVDDGTTRSLQTFGPLLAGPFSGSLAEIVVTSTTSALGITNPVCLQQRLMAYYAITP